MKAEQRINDPQTDEKTKEHTDHKRASSQFSGDSRNLKAVLVRRPVIHWPDLNLKSEDENYKPASISLPPTSLRHHDSY